ncbi:MAG TPA: exopolysaccharide biosynthesis protein [Rhodanobacteraceae bacterium]|nr:exopolysaccharide biosynthesis protein [Rhodanobacteraceae bacterium]
MKSAHAKARIHEARTTELLKSALEQNTGDEIPFGDFLDPLGERAFGFLVLVLAIPNFIPVPIGIGGVMGVLVILVGLQMLLGFAHPWLPGVMRRKGIARASIERFIHRITPVLRWLEHVCRPRFESLTRQPVHRISGFLLVVTGVALALPIPFTNYVFGLLLLVFAVALIERDGIVLTLAWIASIAIAGTILMLSQAVVATIKNLF